ncbi:DNA polymerase III subunit epsilon [Corynebacterium uterequi]|uniref:DNA polymerase III epsilon subunit-like 3'-5' exonuclease n=1 Tax=Corynebacterium uterequi TaxID=1072256 RepID=A0A0G3HBV5_9CORY|nr:DNA polymerase III subunit epsilon [Corynebacterium uterequi]AKK10165.1 DNA polymerase III epsilon subunit-like 3'-5' exonuclease [Corynebacterium uterequi]
MSSTAVEPAADPSVQEYPYVAVVGHASGLHPATSRLITLDAVTFSDAGEIGEHQRFVFNPGTPHSTAHSTAEATAGGKGGKGSRNGKAGKTAAKGKHPQRSQHRTDPGPTHMHGLTAEEIAEAVAFSKHLKALDALLDGRVLIAHDAPSVWGFIVSEARIAMHTAARANRSRGRGRHRRRRRVGHVPEPALIVDTLATARRQLVTLPDTRVAAVARHYGLDAPDPTASVERARRDAAEVARELTDVLIELYLEQLARDADSLVQYEPGDLRADRAGLQRSSVRVDAVDAPRPLPNPGVYDPAEGLKAGMEVVVAPEIAEDPDRIIEAALRAELVYSEKLTRESSLVVCNAREKLVGKAMHAARKGIPLVSDREFLDALTTMRA